MADDDVKFKESTKPMTAELRTTGGKDVSNADAVIPAGTKQGEANAANAGSRGMELPDKGKNEEAGAKPEVAETDKQSLIARVLDRLGLSSLSGEQKRNIEADNQLAGGGKPSADKVMASAERVAGGDIAKINSADLIAAVEGLKKSGAVMAEANSAQYQAGAAKQQTKDAGVVPA